MTGFCLKLHDRVERIERPGITGTVVHFDKVGNTTCFVRWDYEERGSNYFNIERKDQLQLVEVPIDPFATSEGLDTESGDSEPVVPWFETTSSKFEVVGAPIGIGLLVFDVKNI